ncbi:MAG: hypothetical protein ACRDRL_08575 [Sciscionella sp.]
MVRVSEPRLIPTPQRRAELEQLLTQLNHAVWATHRCLYGPTSALRAMGEDNLDQALRILARGMDTVADGTPR